MGIARTVIVCLCAMLFVSCGGPKVATPSDDTNVPGEDRTLTNTDKDFLQDMKSENPDDYDLLYELSKDDDDLMVEFIDKESKREEIAIELFDGSGNKVEDLNSFLALFPIDTNPSDAAKEFMGFIKSENYNRAFEMLHPNGLEKQKYGENINGFSSSWQATRAGIRQKDVNVYSLALYRVGDVAAVEAIYTIWGFFAPMDVGVKNPTSTLMPPTGGETTDQEGKDNIASDFWNYRESGKASMILMPHQGKWLIYALP